MKKLCIMTAIVLSAVMLLSSCGLSKRRAAKVELYAVDNEEVIGGSAVPYHTYSAETMEKAVECFAETAPDMYNSEEMRIAVGRGELFVPDNGDEIISYTICANFDELFVIVIFKHGEDKIGVVKHKGEYDIHKMKVGGKSVFYRTDEIDGEEIITSIFYKPEDGSLLQIFKIPEEKVDKSIEFTKEEITALGEDFFNFKSEALKDYFSEDYFAGDTEDTQE